MTRKPHLQHTIFQDEAAARRALEELRWPTGHQCLKCGSFNVELIGGEKHTHRAGLLRCKDCRQQFTVTVGTVFHRSKVPLHKWMQVIYLEDTPGIAANSWQIAQVTGLSHKTVDKMRARIYSGVGEYEGPNNIFGRQVASYVRAQRPEGYQRPPKPLTKEIDLDTYDPRTVPDFRNWYAWRGKHPLGQPIEGRGVLTVPGNAHRGDLLRTEKILQQLLATQPVKLLKKRRTKKIKPSQERWLPKKPRTRPKSAAKGPVCG